MTEIKDVLGYKGLYKVTANGEVWSCRKGRFLLQCVTKNGYKQLNLIDENGLAKTTYVHRIVAEAFIPNHDNKPLVNHLDENKQNNNVLNLEWATKRENLLYGNAINKIKSKLSFPVIQLDISGNFIKLWDSLIEVERTLNIDHSNISRVCKGIRNTCGGYKWKFAMVGD